MSDREIMYQLLDSVPDNKISYIIGYIQGLIVEGSDAPNAETIAAMQETDEMIKKGTGQHFEGSAEDFVKTLLEE